MILGLTSNEYIKSFFTPVSAIDEMLLKSFLLPLLSTDKTIR